MSLSLVVFGYGDVDRRDMDLVLDRMSASAMENDSADVDRDGDISVLDARLVFLNGTRPGCAHD